MECKLIIKMIFLKNLYLWGFKTNPLNKVIEGTENLIKNYNEVEKKEKI